MSDDIARLIRLEMTVQQHAELLLRAVSSMESQTIINERLANHIEDTKRVWELLESHERSLITIQTRLVEMQAFHLSARKVGWAVAIFLSGGLAYLIQFWANRHAG